MKQRVLPTLIIALVGASIGSFLMMLYASTHFAGVAGPNHSLPAVSAAPLQGISDQDRIVSAVKRTKPSVVAIQLDVNGQRVVPFFQGFFGQGGPGVEEPYKGKASGSGFVYDTKGDIVTNAHVVTPPQGGNITKLTVVFANGNHVPAHVVAENIGADLAVIRVDNYKKLPPPLQFANFDRVEQGQWAIAIGEPLELQQTVTLGVVSAFDRKEPIQNDSGQTIVFKGLLQTSAPINPGNSGGPLIDDHGKVIGINQSTVKSAYAQGIGFAIPANTVQRVVAAMLAHPGITQGTNEGYMGIEMADLTPGLRNQIGYTSGPNGIAVIAVVPGSPADKAGIEPGNVILSVDGKAYTKMQDLVKYIAGKKPGTVVRIDLWAQGLKKFAAVTLTERPATAGTVP